MTHNSEEEERGEAEVRLFAAGVENMAAQYGYLHGRDPLTLYV